VNEVAWIWIVRVEVGVERPTLVPSASHELFNSATIAVTAGGFALGEER